VMGGSVHLVSALGQGSTFSLELELPLVQVQSQPELVQPALPRQSLHILVVGDSVRDYRLTELCLCARTTRATLLIATQCQALIEHLAAYLLSLDIRQ
jgi:hypothetical protein